LLTAGRVEKLCRSSTWPIIRYAHAALEEFWSDRWHGRPAPESRARCACHIGSFQMRYASLLVV